MVGANGKVSVLGMVAIMWLLPARAGGDERTECSGAGPWHVVLAMDGQTAEVAGPAAEFTVRELLAAELRRRGIAVCEAGARGEPPLATLTITVDPSSTAAHIAVADEVTRKRTERVVQLAGVPPDGRALFLAIATDELLRATWAELALYSEPAAVAPTVPAATTAELRTEVVREVDRQRPRRVELGVRALVEVDRIGGGRRGGALVSRWWPTEPLGMRLEVVALDGPRRAAPSGAFRASGMGLALGSDARLREPERGLTLGLGLGVRVERLRLVGLPNPGARGLTGPTTLATLGFSGSVGWRFTPAWSVATELGASLPWLSPRGRDGDVEVPLVDAPLATAGLAVGWAP